MSYDPSPSYPYRPPQQAPQYQQYDSSPSYEATYPWQPPIADPPEPPRRRPPHPPLGHHSDLRILRSAYRWQRRTATLAALGYFTLFLVLSAFAPSVMSADVTDGLPTGLLLALIQIPVTWLAIALYEHTARRYVDPIADRIRKQSAVDAKREAAR
ncbi:DUF485 domain-containing protein [Streptomyces gilvus]|uniref:DUF485 domain-containing protein n=1 Tax=Streptomyces gilvus TaxID=2920937 RepID=UPI001F0EB017|nr:DUF485 domain-containing protein [Streptomyces sp. CME 23]MCH5673881.1 DUF485 domain-containing protein [Streptomyces sp. CME 23]